MKKHILTLFLLFFLLIKAGSVMASSLNYFWTGAHDGVTWKDAGNWTSSTTVSATFTPSGTVTTPSTTFPDINTNPTITTTNVYFTIGVGAGSPVSITGSIAITKLSLGTNAFPVTVNLTTNYGSSSSNALSIGTLTYPLHGNFFNVSNGKVGISTFSNSGTLKGLSGSVISITNLTNVATSTYGSTILIDNSTFTAESFTNNYNSSTFYGNFTASTNSTATIDVTLDNFGKVNIVSGSTLNFYKYIDPSSGNNIAAYYTGESTGIFNLGSANLSMNYPLGAFVSSGTVNITGSVATHPVVSLSAQTYVQNDGSMTADTATFNMLGDGAANDGAYLQNDLTFNSIGCTFNVGVVPATDYDAYILNSGSTAIFTDNASTFNFTGTVSSLGSPSSLSNTGTFLALGGSKFTFHGTNTEIDNGGGLSSGTAYFVLGASSAIIFGTSGSGTDATGAELYNDPTHGQFILNSDANNSATIINYNLGNNHGITGGMFYVQRFITGGSNTYRGYRLLTSTVNNGSGLIDFSYLNASFTPGYTGAVTYNGIDTFGSGSGFSQTSPLGNPLMYIYNETLNPASPIFSYTSGKNVGITSISTTTLGWTSTATGSTVTGSTTVPIANGFLLYYLGSTLRGSNTSTGTLPDNSTVSFKGYINQGDVTTSLWYTPGGGGGSPGLSYSAGVYSAGFNMVGNPYTSTIDLNLVSYYNTTIGVGSNTYNTYYELDDVSKQYYSYIPSNGSAGGGGTTSGGNASEYVASGQGFFVYVTAASQTLTFKEIQKVYNKSLLTAGSSPFGLLVARNNQLSGLNSSLESSATTRAIIQGPENELAGLHLKLKLDSADYGETGIYFSKKGIDKYDHNDAVYLPGIGTKLSFSSFTADGVNVGINSMSNYIKGKRIKLDVESSTDGVFTISLSDIANIDPSIFNVYIIDNLKKDSVDLVQYNKISFNISVADASTYGPNRFVLAVERKPLGAYQLVTLKGAKANGGVTVTWKTNNEGDFTGFGLQKLDPTTSTYSTVDSLQSNGSGSYTYDDPATITGVNTYRLEQNDIDGNVTYSKPISVNYSLVASPGALSVYPNPVKDAMILDFSGITSANADSYNIEIYNSLGILMIQKASTSNSVTEDVSTLRPGVYVVSVKTNSGNPVGNATFVKNQ